MKKTKDSSEMWRELIEIVCKNGIAEAIGEFFKHGYPMETIRLYALALTVAQVSVEVAKGRGISYWSLPWACCYLSAVEDGMFCHCHSCLLSVKTWRCALDNLGKDPTKKVMRIYKKNYDKYFEGHP